MSTFKLIFKPIENIDCFILQKDDGSEFEILSGYGCGLNGWKIPIFKQEFSFLELLKGYKEGDNIYKIAPDTNAGCRLTPFPGRVAFALFTWEKNTYKLKNNVSWAPHALHGFLQNQKWKFESFENCSESCSALFSCDWPGAFSGFPFPFKVINKIIFTGDTYSVESSIQNIGKSTLPYSEGWHPYYSLGEKIDFLNMTLPQSKIALLDKNDLPTGKFKEEIKFASGSKIKEDFINDCFCLGDEFSKPKKTECKKAHVLLEGRLGKLDLWQQTGFEQYNAIQIYTPPERTSIAIEPMTAEPDALNHHRGLIEIPPGESRKFTFGAKYQAK